jgi:hypothetical protein
VAPDLVTTLSAAGLGKAAAKMLEAESARRDGLRLSARRRGFRGPWVLEFPDVHDFLTDQADWDGLTWDFASDGLEKLARTLEWLYSELPGELAFESTWGEEPIGKMVSRDELLRIVRGNRIGTRARYRLPAAQDSVR